MKKVTPVEKKTSKYYTFGLGMLLLLAGGIGGWYAHIPVKASTISSLRENPSDYKFTDPLLLMHVPEDSSTPQLQSLKKAISDYVTVAKNNKKATDISVYFRQLNEERWVGVNQDETYAPASMLKAVSLVAFLRETQNNPAIAEKRVTIGEGSINEDTNQENYPPADPIKVGKSYSTEDLLDHMITDSDNNAAFAIDSLTGKNTIDKTYNDLTIPNPGDTMSIDFISPKMYSRVFRSLYNGAYLSDSVSEQALELMSKTNFTVGLVAGVPVGTTVSHKFGERTINLADLDVPGGATASIKELHDCGIVYAPNDPYFICVMTKGDDFPSLQKIISDISGVTWHSVQQLDVKK